MEKCSEHSGHNARIDNIEKENQNQWTAIHRIECVVGNMKNWVIAGMGAVILQGAMFIGNLLKDMVQ